MCVVTITGDGGIGAREILRVNGDCTYEPPA